MHRCRRSLRVAVAALCLVALSAAPARAFQGPYTTVVTGFGGFMLDLDVRWPDGAPPASGWPVLFIGHGAGGDKNTSADNAENFADEGYVSVAWTNRLVSTSPTPSVFAADLAAMKTWLVDDFQAEANVTVPVDPAKFGITGFSLGGYTSWSAALMGDDFAVIAPMNWGFHVFENGIVANGSIERITGGPLSNLFPEPYDSASLAAGIDAAFGPALDAFASVTIPAMTQVAMLDGRHGGTYGLRDFLALTAGGPRFVYIGTGGHGTPETDGPFRLDLRRRWLEFYLQGGANGIDAELPIQIALLVTNEHLAYASWPPPGQQTARLHLRDAGRLMPSAPVGSESADTLVNDPGTFTWDDAAPGFGLNLIRNNLPKTTIAYETAPLTEEVLLLGEPSVELHVAGTGSRYQVNVHLYDRPDVGDQVLLAFGTATLAASPTAVTVPLTLTGRRLPAGHRLRLEITNRDDQDLDYTDGFTPGGGGFLRYIPFFELSTTEVFHDATRVSSIDLPLIGRGTLPVAGAACDPAPRAGCRVPALAGRSPLTVKDGAVDTRDSVSWRWNKGTATTFAELGDPIASDDYVFCVYGAGARVLEARAPAGGVCRTKPCWKQLGSPTSPKGFSYADRDLTPDGVSKLKLTPGEALKAKATLKAKGENLGASGYFPTLPLALPVTAQLQSTSTCWEVTYATAKLNTAETFKAE